MLSRREFIKRSSLSTGLIMAGGLGLVACSGVKREAHTVAPKMNQASLSLTHPQREVLYLASLAPSSHNTQPWRVRAESPNTWVVEADARGRLPAVDPNNRELLLSIGAFVENLVLAAGSMGLNPRVQVIAGHCMQRDVVRIVMKEGAPRRYPLGRIRKRRTVKHGQLPKEISAGDMKILKEEAKDQLFYFPRGTKHAQCIQAAAVENYRIQTNRDAAQRELVRWLRLSDADAHAYRDGLTTEGMEITGLTGWFVRHFASPEDFMKQEYRNQGVDQVAKRAAQGGGWLVITSQGESPADLIDAGRRFERLALAACELGIGLHPMTQLLEEKHGLSQLAKHHDTDLTPQFVLRAGYVDAYPAPVSLRRPVAWFFSG